MLQSDTQDEIGTRVKVINRTPRWLARAAGVDPMTVHRGAKTRRKHDQMVQAVEAEELRLLRYLAALHPQAAIEAATVAMCPNPLHPRKDAA